MRPVTADRWGLLSSGCAPCRGCSPCTTWYQTPENPPWLRMALSEFGHKPLCATMGASFGIVPYKQGHTVLELSWLQQDFDSRGRQPHHPPLPRWPRPSSNGEFTAVSGPPLLPGGLQEDGGWVVCVMFPPHLPPIFHPWQLPLHPLGEDTFTTSLSPARGRVKTHLEPPKGPVHPLPRSRCSRSDAPVMGAVPPSYEKDHRWVPGGGGAWACRSHGS